MLNKYNSAMKFYSLSLLIPWALWFIVAYWSHLPVQGPALRFGEQVLGMFGLVAPTFVAAFFFLKDRDLFHDLKKRVVNVQAFDRIYLVLAAFLILASIILAQLISLLFGHGVAQFRISGNPSFTSVVFSPWFILIFAPIVEELAWHSYGTDALRRRFNLFVTCTIFSMYWIFWHLPLSFINGYYHSNVMAEGLLYSLNFVFSLFVFVILMNWLYYKTKRNIFIAVIFHLSANVSNEIFDTHPDSKVIQTVLLLAVVIVVLAKDRRMFFDKDVME